MKNISRIIDHTLLRQDVQEVEIQNVCIEAVKHKFFSVFINPVYVPLAVSLLNGSDVKIGTTIGFPLGTDSVEMKYAQSCFLIHKGAQELDMVINIGALKDGNNKIVEEEVCQVVLAAEGNCVKVIIETCLLTDEEKLIASQIAENSGANFVKTSTGFSHGGATANDVKIIREAISEKMGVKASGGIKTYSDFNKMVKAGASRIGTSSSVKIIDEYNRTN